MTWRMLGRDSASIFAEDTMYNGALQAAVNAGVREVATRIGVSGFQQITVVAETFAYALDSDFIQNGLPHMPFSAVRIPADGTSIRGMVRGTDEQFGTLVMAQGITMYNIVGDTLWVDDVDGDGDVIHLRGPIEGNVMTDGADTTNIYPIDRMAVCYWAAYIYGSGISHPQTPVFLNAFAGHIRQRGGETAGLPVE